MSISAMKMALEALEFNGNIWHIDCKKDDAITAIRQALAQEVTTQVTTQVTTEVTKNVDAVNMKQEHVDETAKGGHDTLGSEWAECVKLPIVVHVRKQRDGETHISTREGITPVLPDDLIMRGVAGEEYPIGRELFERTYTFDTAPPKREWVGLTDEEINIIGGDAWGGWPSYDDEFTEIYRLLEAKLKEKNT